MCRILVNDLEYVVRQLKEFPQVIANMMLLSTLLGTRSVSFQEDINGCLEFARQKLKMKPEKDLPPKAVSLYNMELRTTQVPKAQEPGAVASSSADVTVDEAGVGVKANAEGEAVPSPKKNRTLVLYLSGSCNPLTRVGRSS